MTTIFIELMSLSRSHTVCRDYANKSGSNKQRFLESLTSSKIKYLVWIGKNRKLYRNSMKMSLAFASFTIFFTENVWELVTAPSESLPTRQNGGENRDKAYLSICYVLCLTKSVVLK